MQYLKGIMDKSRDNTSSALPERQAGSRPNTQSSRSSESPAWWRVNHSLTEIAAQVAQVLEDRSQFERRIEEISFDNERLNLRCRMANDELANERSQHQIEVAALQERITGLLKQYVNADRGRERLNAELAAKEKLMNDEFERRIQALRVDFKQQRINLESKAEKFERQIAKLEQALSSCICRERSVTRIKPQERSISEIDPWSEPYRTRTPRNPR
jgi:chromosome segregation ATPase